LPVSDAQYYALLSRAFNGGVTRYEMMWEISLVEAQSMFHAAGLLEGESYLWPDPRLSKSGREMLRIREMREQFRQGLWQPEIDL
jgi:hypothetical protein